METTTRHRLDADVRRTAIADAVGLLLMRQPGSLPGMREIADELGVTTGVLQHHFRNKEEMLLFSLEHHCRRCAVRLSERAASEARTPRGMLFAIVTELLPLDEERMAETSVALAFMARVTTDAAFADHYRAMRALLLGLLTEQFERAGIDEPRVAAAILAQSIEGMRTECLLVGPDALEVDALLDRLLPSTRHKEIP